jgi:hypothetical protein
MATHDFQASAVVQSNGFVSEAPVARHVPLNGVGNAIDAYCIPKTSAPSVAGEPIIDGAVRRFYDALKRSTNIVEFGIGAPDGDPTLLQAPLPPPRDLPVRSTFPGNTTFKDMCNSYLRKLLRGRAPDTLYRIAHATLPNGDRVIARLRFTVILEDICVEAARDPTKPPATISLVVGALVEQEN